MRTVAIHLMGMLRCQQLFAQDVIDSSSSVTKIDKKGETVDKIVACWHHGSEERLKKFRRKDIVFVDTVGRSQRAKKELAELKKFVDGL